MNTSRWEKLGAVAGMVFGVLAALAFLTLGDAPDFVDDPDTVGRFFADNEGRILATTGLAALAALALAWFASGLREAMGRDDRGVAVPGAGAVGIGAAIAASSYAISGGILAVGAQRVNEHGDEGAASAFLNYDLFQVIFGASAPIGFAVILAGVAVFTLGPGGFLPRWVGWVSLVLAVVGLIPPISWTLTFGMALWSILVGILMLRRPAAA
ncbi:hypothetical protein BH24ACT3_BH24ACT3_15980 [soil metagenome]